ncbi:MAG: hypothetical protein K9M45_08455, partial [Kiritimatiellales bacterium]|nr:hypothetical protein [Kiritimatiellales bacterium]
PTMASLTSFGTSVGGHDIMGLAAGNPDRRIALVGAIHAGESGPELMIPAVERLLTENPELLRKTGVAILPSVNVDERERLVTGCPWYLRTNARGVDINRNFDADWEEVDFNYGLVSNDPDAATYRGPKPESEPETQAVTAFLDAVRPKAILSYHWLACITGARFLAPRLAKDDADYLNACNALVDPFIAAFYPDPENRWNAGLCFGSSTGSLPAYAYRTLRVPCFDIENDGNPEAGPASADETTPELLSVYQERHYRGILAILKTISK